MPSEIKGSMAVLGLLAQQPDSVAGLGLRLKWAFPSAGWPGNIVHNSISSLEVQGLVQVVRRGAEPALHVYEAPPRGAAHFRRDLVRSSVMPPAMRDALRARLRYIENPVDLRIWVRDAEAREKQCREMAEEVRRRYREAREHGQLHPASLSATALIDEIQCWHDEAKAIQRLRKAVTQDDVGRDTLDGA
jgi:hypothetical protein